AASQTYRCARTRGAGLRHRCRAVFRRAAAAAHAVAAPRAKAPAPHTRSGPPRRL
ncbi:MAG: hypothetical protein AVDCRST_MAG26-2662, partial [uncultured Chloroflexia bacterium]